MKETKNITTKVYIALDCLLDVRLSTLNVISEDFALAVMQDPAYYVREEDHFGTDTQKFLKKETYQKVYDTYKPVIVRNAIKTRMMEFVQQLVERLFSDSMNTPYHSHVEVEVNTWPFELDATETNALQAIVALELSNIYKVTVVHNNPKYITAKHAKDNYRAMIMYHYHDWLNEHNEQIKKKALLDNTGLYLPRIYQNYALTGEDLAMFEKNQTDPFSFTQRILAPFVTIQWLPIALYCASVPSNLNAYTQN